MVHDSIVSFHRSILRFSWVRLDTAWWCHYSSTKCEARPHCRHYHPPKSRRRATRSIERSKTFSSRPTAVQRRFSMQFDPYSRQAARHGIHHLLPDNAATVPRNMAKREAPGLHPAWRHTADHESFGKRSQCYDPPLRSPSVGPATCLHVHQSCRKRRSTRNCAVSDDSAPSKERRGERQRTAVFACLERDPIDLARGLASFGAVADQALFIEGDHEPEVVVVDQTLGTAGHRRGRWRTGRGLAAGPGCRSLRPE